MMIHISVLQNPDYTGDNRCMACTVVNLLISVALATTVALIRPLAALLVFAVCVYLIWARGYLVPGTPTLTKRYLPNWMLAWFGKAPSSNEPTGLTGKRHAQDEQYEVDLEKELLSAGILEIAPDDGDLQLSERAEEVWMRELSERSEIRENELSALVHQEPTELTLTERFGGIALTADADVLGHWPSKAALIADQSVVPVLEQLHPYWGSLTIHEKGQLLAGMRIFVPECPTSPGDIEIIDEVVESCCANHDVTVVQCANGGETLIEREMTTISN